MHTVAQIIEELQINNLPHIPDGSFIITSKQRDAIESLLSQQAVVVESDEESALKTYPVSPSSFIFNKGTDDEIVQKFDDNDDFREGFVSGCNHIRQQLSPQIEGLQRWKAEAIAVMPDMQAIGKALKVPLGQSIHDKILPAIQQLSQQQQTINNAPYLNNYQKQQLFKDLNQSV